MQLTHTFTVPAPIEETWAAFNDIESVAGCFPGAAVTSVEGDDFKGNCKVKLGPIALVYTGSGTFLEKDPAAHKFVVEAKGKDKRGNGTAGALVTATLSAAGADATDVEVITDLAITGKPAQFGRGVMQDVSDKLLGQFVACLEKKVGDDTSGATEELVDPSVASAPAPPRPEPTGDAAPATPINGTSAAAASPGPATGPSNARHAAREEDDDALDLGATVLPILAKTYWRQIAAVVVVMLVISRLRRRH